MRRNRVLLASLVGSGLALGALGAAPACSHDGGTANGPSTGLAQLEADTGVTWIAVADPRFGTTAYLYPVTTPPVTLTTGADRAQAAMKFFSTYASVFGIVQPANELTLDVSSSANALQYASFTQTEGAASVYGSRLTMVFDASGHIKFISGLLVPDLRKFATTAALSSAQATDRAQVDLRSRYPATQVMTLEATPAASLTIYALGSAPVLAYSAVVSYAFDRETDTIARQRVVMRYLVDANSGAILQAIAGTENQYSGDDVVQVTASGLGQQSNALNAPSPPLRTFPALATKDDDGGAPRAPYFMQLNARQLTGSPVVPKFVRQPQDGGPPVLTSNSLVDWDTNTASGTPPDNGSAVDAYFYLGEADAWWQRWGRNGYDDSGTRLGILVHDGAPIGNPPARCTNQAYWDGLGSIHVCPTDPGGPFPTVGAASIDLGVLGHEYQHAVTQYAIGLVYQGEPGAINESLSDTFGQFIAHDMIPNSANCIVGNVWVPSTGLRNMIDPHRSLTPQPDSVLDPLYGSTTASYDLGHVHLNTGVSNKAWSLLTFGGHTETSPTRVVPASLSLGWLDSERLYVALVSSRSLPPSAGFWNLAYELDGVARTVFGDTSTQRNANACAWYAVGVLSEAELKSQLGVDPCLCGAPEAGACDAGSDAGRKDAAADGGPYSCTKSFNACTIVSASDVATALGTGLGSGTGPNLPGFWQCGYPAQDVDNPDASASLVFNMTCSPTVPSTPPPIPQPSDSNQTISSVDGIGDEAYWTVTDTHPLDEGMFPQYELSVWYKNLFLTFSFQSDNMQGDPEFPDPESQAEQLARFALANLDTDAGPPPANDGGPSDAGADGGDAKPRDSGARDAGADGSAEPPHC